MHIMEMSWVQSIVPAKAPLWNLARKRTQWPGPGKT
jgi:hypothetical protein